jgi:nucleotide-binding universal stress UspA family protein
MFRSILVPLDGSAFAEQALPLAIQLAQRDNAQLELVRVHEPIAGIYLDRPRTFEADLDQELMVDMNRYLEATADRLAAKSSLRANCVVLKGPVAETIASHAAASEADLVVMTTQGRGPVGRMWFGSVADALVRQSPIPILLVRPTEESSDSNGEPVTRRVLVPLDGSRLAEQALEPALSLGGARGEFTLLRVIPLVNPVAYDPTTVMIGLSTAVLDELQELKRLQEAEAHEYLLQLAERLRARSVNVRTQLATHEHPAIAILDAAAKYDVDAIAMTTRGRGSAKRLLLGSVADKVLRGATTPLLISATPGGAAAVHGTTEPAH